MGRRGPGVPCAASLQPHSPPLVQEHKLAPRREPAEEALEAEARSSQSRGVCQWVHVELVTSDISSMP